MAAVARVWRLTRALQGSWVSSRSAPLRWESVRAEKKHRCGTIAPDSGVGDIVIKGGWDNRNASAEGLLSAHSLTRNSDRRAIPAGAIELVMTVEHWIDLRCHPSTRPEAVRAIQVFAHRSAGAELRMTFRLDGDIPRIRVPSPGVPRIATQLWRHTCFEAFIAMEGQSAYYEFNFAPSGEWAVYTFRGYRNGGPLADEMMGPRIAVRSTASRLELDTLVRLDVLSANHPRASLRIGLSAVIEASDGLSYWALRHPADKPDFHDAIGFALVLQPPGPDA
jgi:hypothetical protein